MFHVHAAHGTRQVSNWKEMISDTKTWKRSSCCLQICRQVSNLNAMVYWVYIYISTYITGIWPFQVYCPGVQLKTKLHAFVCLKTIVQTIYSAAHLSCVSRQNTRTGCCWLQPPSLNLRWNSLGWHTSISPLAIAFHIRFRKVSCDGTSVHSYLFNIDTLLSTFLVFIIFLLKV